MVFIFLQKPAVTSQPYRNSFRVIDIWVLNMKLGLSRLSALNLRRSCVPYLENFTFDLSILSSSSS